MIKAFLVVNIAILSINSVAGCGCIGNTSDAEALKTYATVIKGKVIKMETLEVSNDDDISDITTVIKKFYVQVLFQYKGKISKKVVEIYSGNGHGDCGYPFQIQKSYLIFFDKANTILNTKPTKCSSEFYYTDICYNTREWSETDHDQIVRSVKEKH